MKILGICWNHDSHAAIISNGKLIVSIGEERLSRIKNHYGFPYMAISKCLEIAKLKSNEIDLIAISNKFPASSYLNDIWFNSKTQYDVSNNFPFKIKFKYLKHKFESIFLKIRGYNPDKKYQEKCLKKAFAKLGLNCSYKYYDHHECHAASAYFSSPFDDAYVCVMDQYGDDKCVSLWEGSKNNLKKKKSYSDIMSPGAFYTEITNFLGFKRYRHEGKVLGLAAYGNPNKLKSKLKVLLSFDPRNELFSKIRPLKLKGLDLIIFIFKKLFSKKILFKTTESYKKYFEKIFKNQSKEDIAAGGQATLEEFALDFISYFLGQDSKSNICLAGGTFANVKLNQKILESKGINDMYVFPNMGDGGLAVGAAQLAYFRNSKNKSKRQIPESMYLGNEINTNQIENKLIDLKLNYEYRLDMPKIVAKQISEGKIIGLVQGKMEFGPRALCNRSIIASPIDERINQKLNARLNRTEFMPFAPVIRYENAKKIFPELSSYLAAKYMTVTSNVDNKIAKSIPAVVHVDGTARPQIIKKEENKIMYRILEEYEKITGILALINTSFNAHEEPIVCSIDDALRAYLDNRIDVLIIDNYIISK